MKQQFIAEVKTGSPFDPTMSRNWARQFEIANHVGDMMSIHTDKRWNGSLELLKIARQLTDLDLMGKAINATDEEVYESLEAGADKVLVVGRTPADDLIDKCLIEPFTLEELAALPEDVKAVWNSRDLRDGRMKKETFDEARAVFSGWLCQASNIRTLADVNPAADAILVGTHLAEFADELELQKLQR